MLVSSNIKVRIFLSSLFFCISTCSLYGQYTIQEGCEIGLAATRYPLMLASKLSATHNKPKQALILDIISHSVRTSAEILHMSNRIYDHRHHSYACIAYDASRIISDIKKLYDLTHPNKQDELENDLKEDNDFSPEEKKSLNTLRDIILPIIENSTALYRATEKRDDIRRCNNRLTADDIGALVRSIANILEDEQTKPEQLLAIIYLIYTIFCSCDDLSSSPVAAIRIPFSPSTHRTNGAIRFEQDNWAEVEQFLASLNTHQPDRRQTTHHTTPVVSVSPDAVINDSCPILQESFQNGDHVYRLACGHGIHANTVDNFNRHCQNCPACRQPRDRSREREITFHQAASTATTPATT